MMANNKSSNQPDSQITSSHTFTVGTRKSPLALKQTALVVEAAQNVFPHYKFETRAKDNAAGDIDKVTAFKDMAAKNIWTHELEALMTEKQLDILVHSLKDVPTQLPLNCEIGATIERENPRDAFVVKAGRPRCNIQDLPAGSVVGTSSIRRTAQIAYKYPHLVVKDVRGNVGTRLSKLDADDGPFDALILAAAGLLRLNYGERISQYLDSTNGAIMYAVGQGAIGIENRSDDQSVKAVLNKINHLPSFYAVNAERSLLRTIEGGCSAPLGVESTWVDQTHLQLNALVVSVDGRQSAQVEVTEEVKNVADAEHLGQSVAAQILKKGADKILAEIKAKKPTTAADLEEN